ncbi:urea hydro-lyase/cyanamide hydratase [Patellaria atrata CBS 101060]|uniref:Urea hydro-lyase/cyanamide hydratase n=1 Tax=Patellaria atrata CBS 101060 TaxID=1346257 RepID=A0A9P4SA27_9PEZI|nr:urea hydro-lyase/cyanamide hydratase [Patellaria atrata CBS 101060]
MSTPNPTHTHGWTAVPRSHSLFLKDVSPSNTKPLHVSDLPLPSTPLAHRIRTYAHSHLPPATYNHSMRVFLYGQALARQHFPHFLAFTETFYLTCLLHDIGTTAANMQESQMSFEFRGAWVAMEVLAAEGAERSMWESVAEAVVRHQDLGDVGTITGMGLLVQLATVFDNIGANPTLIHPSTIESVVHAFPRHGWSGCFAATVRDEIWKKPWCHTTAIEHFAEMVENNELMAPYEEP